MGPDQVNPSLNNGIVESTLPSVESEATIEMPFNSAEYLKILEEIPELRELLQQKTKLWEGYTGQELASLALGQFERFFANQPLPHNLPPDFFRLLITLHSAAQAQSIDLENEKQAGVLLIKKVWPQFYPQTGSEDQEAERIPYPQQLAELVTEENPVESLFSYEAEIKVHVRNLQEAQQKVPEVSLKELLDVYAILYLCEGSARTEGAGGKRSLDPQFFGRKEQGSGKEKLEFSNGAKQWYEQLKNRVLSVEGQNDALSQKDITQKERALWEEQSSERYKEARTHCEAVCVKEVETLRQLLIPYEAEKIDASRLPLASIVNVLETRIPTWTGQLARISGTRPAESNAQFRDLQRNQDTYRSLLGELAHEAHRLTVQAERLQADASTASPANYAQSLELEFQKNKAAASSLQERHDLWLQTLDEGRLRLEKIEESLVATSFTRIDQAYRDLMSNVLDDQAMRHLDGRLIEELVEKIIQEEGKFKINEAELSEYIQLLNDKLKDTEGYPPAAEYTRRQERDSRLETLEGEDHRLSLLGSRAQFNSSHSIEVTYSVHGDILAREAVRQQIESILPDVATSDADENKVVGIINSLLDTGLLPLPSALTYRAELSPVRIEKFAEIELNQIDGFPRWAALRALNIQGNFLPDQIFESAEQRLITGFIEKFLVKGGRESSDGSRILQRIEDIHNPVAILALLEHIRATGSGHTNSIAARILDTLLHSPDTEKVEQIVANADSVQRQLCKIFADPTSFMNRFGRYNPYYSSCNLLESGEQTIRQEKYAAVLSEHLSDIELHDFYLLMADRMAILNNLKLAAQLLGEDPAQVIKQYADVLTAHISIDYSESLRILPVLAKELGEEPGVLFEREMQAEEEYQKKSYIHDPMKRLQGVRQLLLLIGGNEKEAVERWLPLEQLEIYSNNLPQILTEIASIEGVPVRTVITRFINLEGSREKLRGLGYSQDLELVKFFCNYAEEVIKDEVEDDLVRRRAAFILSLSANTVNTITRSQNTTNISEETIIKAGTLHVQLSRMLDTALADADPAVQYLALEGLVNSKVFAFKHLPASQNLRQHEFKDELKPYLYEFQTPNVGHLLAQGIMQLDPSTGRIFEGGGKLGKLKNMVLSHLMTFVGERMARSSQEDQADVVSELLSFLKNIRITFESSDSSIIDKRLLFLNNYKADQSPDLRFQEELQAAISNEGISAEQALRESVSREFERLLQLSNNSDLRREYQRALAVGKIDGLRRQEIESNLVAMRRVVMDADTRNRENVQRLAGLDPQSLEYAEAVVPWETSISQVGPSEVTHSILDQGTLCDALLGSDAFDQEYNLSSHISTTHLHVGDLSTIARRLPSSGNPHGVAVDRVYGNIRSWPYSACGENGGPRTGGPMGTAHQFIHLGIPSTEITAIVLADPDADALSQKQAVALKGFYIPIFDKESGNLLLDEKEFDDMRAFFYPLQERGYPLEVITECYAYYQNITAENVPVDRHAVVMRKLHDYLHEHWETPDPSIDPVALVDFLRNNDLNSHPVAWYQEQPLLVLLNDIRRSLGYKNRQKVRELLFSYPDEGSPARRPLNEAMYLAQETERKRHVFLDNLLDYQIPIAHENVHEAESIRLAADAACRYLLFNEALKKDKEAEDGEGKRVDVEAVHKAAETVRDIRRSLFITLWEKVWEQAAAQAESGEYSSQKIEAFRQVAIPALGGSAGRGEMTLGSDLDYAFIIDDGSIPEELLQGTDTATFLDSLSHFLRSEISPHIAEGLRRSGLIPDGGLDREEKLPIILLSSVQNLTIDLHADLQQEEPTNVISITPCFPKDDSTIVKLKYALFTSPAVPVLESYVTNDLSVAKGKRTKSLFDNFETLFESAASGNVLEEIKNSLQRTLSFKLDQLLFRSVAEDNLSIDKVQNLPGQTLELIDFLAENEIISDQDAEVCKELWAFTYKLKFLGEVFSEEAQGGEHIAKVKNVRFKVDNFSYDERVRLFHLLKEFRNNVLYK